MNSVVFFPPTNELPGHAKFTIWETNGEFSIFIEDAAEGGSFLQSPEVLSEILTRIYRRELQGIDPHLVTVFLDAGEKVYRIPFKKPFAAEGGEFIRLFFGWMFRFRTGRAVSKAFTRFEHGLLVVLWDEE